MTKDEALKLALDWFMCYADGSMSRNNAENLADEIVDDIKATLAQPEQEPVADGLIRDYISALLANKPDAAAKSTKRMVDYVFATPPAAQPAQQEPIDLVRAIEYADARWSGVDVPIEWARHFAEGIRRTEAAHGITGENT
jgi:hypothetical protein